MFDAARHLPDGVKVVIVGDSSFSDEYVDAMKEAARCRWRAWFSPVTYSATELAAAFENAAVFVQPSDVEGLPLTLLEALSYGTPVVASDIAPHQEVLSPCLCPGHRLFRAGDPNALGQGWSPR